MHDLVSFLACFYRTSSKRMRGLWLKGGKFRFSRCRGVRWVEAMFHGSDIIPENVPAVVLYLSKYITNEADLGCREKAEGLLDALLHHLFKFTVAFFCDVFGVVCATSKKVRAIREARVATAEGLMNVMCTQLLHTMLHVIPGGWENSLGVEVGSSLIKGIRVKFLRALIDHVQTRFNRSQWVRSAMAEDWVEASSCLCERVFSHVTATDFGQST